MRVSTNINSMTAQRYVRAHSEEQALEDSKLSSGDRIVRSAVDPSGLAISETMKSKIRSNYQAERNSNDSISLMQVAEGSLSTMQQMGSRLRELAMQAANDTVGEAERRVVDAEFQQLKNEVKRITVSTSFNGNHIIKGGASSTYDLQVGVDGVAELDRIQYDMSKVMDSQNNFGIANVDLRTKEGAQRSLSAIDNMMSQIGASRAQLGSMGNRINSVVQNLMVSRENMSASNSKIRDTDIAKEAAIKLQAQIAQSASLSMLKISNDAPGAILKLVS
ncbi:flagellin FliC [Bacteriovorax stolpii]|uniref:Flagellin n=1 Tax=Bacteriovorax stolpii TaxID=960 RepID=A0A2K9NTZ6_BACTC|nr:flagellin [Bacteriovorax stolpii]AUN98990.1 flagellin FliC [Bacteriovorax stolpii]QDK41014.1 flagellin FliC [Bacteriovorax stolpii]TDP55486.1 flagellin [Bacteriovorax stolpii]